MTYALFFFAVVVVGIFQVVVVIQNNNNNNLMRYESFAFIIIQLPKIVQSNHKTEAKMMAMMIENNVRM